MKVSPARGTVSVVPGMASQLHVPDTGYDMKLPNYHQLVTKRGHC